MHYYYCSTFVQTPFYYTRPQTKYTSDELAPSACGVQTDALMSNSCHSLFRKMSRARVNTVIRPVMTISTSFSLDVDFLNRSAALVSNSSR